MYRAHLRAYTEGILRGIEDWERKESSFADEVPPASPMAELPMPDGNSYHALRLLIDALVALILVAPADVRFRGRRLTPGE